MNLWNTQLDATVAAAEIVATITLPRRTPSACGTAAAVAPWRRWPVLQGFALALASNSSLPSIDSSKVWQAEPRYSKT